MSSITTGRSDITFIQQLIEPVTSQKEARLIDRLTRGGRDLLSRESESEELHAFYCGQAQWEKRLQKADLSQIHSVIDAIRMTVLSVHVRRPNLSLNEPARNRHTSGSSFASWPGLQSSAILEVDFLLG